MYKEHPSKEYLENIKYYKEMHTEGYHLIDGRKRNADEAYDGKSTINYAFIIKKIIKKNQILSMLDYGCGKGYFYKNSFRIGDQQIKSLKNYWKIDIDLYDPCYAEHELINEDKVYDLTICVDVLEHIPSQDINWILYKIFKKTKKFIFLNVACYPAIALLPNGQNAHININKPDWWHKKIVEFKNKFINLKVICICALKEDGKISYFPLQYDDKITNYTFK